MYKNFTEFEKYDDLQVYERKYLRKAYKQARRKAQYCKGHSTCETDINVTR